MGAVDLVEAAGGFDRLRAGGSEAGPLTMARPQSSSRPGRTKVVAPGRLLCGAFAHAGFDGAALHIPVFFGGARSLVLAASGLAALGCE